MPLRTYLSNRNTQRKCRLNGIIPSKRMPQKAKLQKHFSNHILYDDPQLPPKVNLRYEMTPVEDQSNIGSCVANAFAGAYEYLLKRTSGRHIDVSRLFIYYNARVKDEESDENITDSGCTVTSGIETLEEFGVCLEELWTYDTKRVNKCPNDEAYKAAEDNTINDALQVKINLHEMKSCLAQGFPFIFGLELYKTFDKAEKGGNVPMPKPGDKSRGSHGSHAMLAVGYSDHSKCFIVRNSWGEDWGDKGYCYIPYAYMTDPDYCYDAWAIRKLEVDDIGHEHWDEVDEVDYQEEDEEEENEGDEEDDDGEIEEQEEDEGEEEENEADEEQENENQEEEDEAEENENENEVDEEQENEEEDGEEENEADEGEEDKDENEEVGEEKTKTKMKKMKKMMVKKTNNRD